MIAPFAYISFFYSLGILLSYHCIPSKNFLFYLGSLATLAIISYCKKHFKICLICLTLFFILSGIYFHYNFYDSFYKRKIGNIFFEKNNLPLNEPIYSEFQLLEEPAETDKKIYLVGKLVRIKYKEKFIKVEGNARISIVKKENFVFSEYHYGDIIGAYVSFKLPHLFKNEGFFDYNKYLYANNIHILGYIKNWRLLKKTGTNGERIIRKFYELKTYIDKLIWAYFSENGKINQQIAFMEALLIGKRENLSDDMKELMQKSGLFHLIAISGFNLSIILYFFYIILNRIIKLGRKLSNVCLLFIIPQFIILSSASSSVLRTSIMATLFILGLILYQPVRLLNLIGISSFIILLFRPNQLFDIGFQLTFLVTLSLIILGKRIRSIFPKKFNFFWLNLSFSIASLIATFFHNIFLFHKISFISLVLNIIMVPLFSLILILGYSFVLIPLPSLKLLICYILKKLLFIFFWTIQKSCNLPMAYILIGRENYFFALIIFILLITIFYIKEIKYKLIMILILAIVLTANNVRINKSDEKFEMKMFDVGHGDSIFIKFPNNIKMLIDGGGSVLSDFDIGKNVVSSALLEAGHKSIDYVLLTHEHPDHINGLFYILKEFKVKEFWDANCSYKKPICKRVLNLAREKGIKIKHPKEGEVVKIGRAKLVFLYSPLNFRFFKINNNSIVLKIEIYGRKILLTGDIEKENENFLVSKYGKELSSDIIKVPHHGSNTSSSEEFLNQASGKLALLSVGKNSFYNLPSIDVIKRYLRKRYQLYRTDKNGEIKITIDANGFIDVKVFEYL